MSLKDFDKDYYEAFKILDSLCASGLSDFDGATENLNVNGIPLGLWDKYAKRYPYEIKITFEDKRAIITAESPRSMEFGVRTICYFPTGERYGLKATKGIKDMAALKKMYLHGMWEILITLESSSSMKTRFLKYILKYLERQGR